MANTYIVIAWLGAANNTESMYKSSKLKTSVCFPSDEEKFNQRYQIMSVKVLREIFE